VVVKPAEHHALREPELERIEYARLVRKGNRAPRYATSAQAGYAVRSSLWSGGGPCHGAFAGYAIELRLVTLAPRLGGCRGHFDNAYLRAIADELDLELRAAHAWDVGRVALSLGLAAGGSYLRQKFSSDGVAPDRDALAAHLGMLAGATVELVQGFYGGVELDAMTYFYNQQTMGMTQVSTPFALRFQVLLLGKHW